MIPFVDLPGQFRALKPEIDAAVGRVLENAEYILARLSLPSKRTSPRSVCPRTRPLA